MSELLSSLDLIAALQTSYAVERRTPLVLQAQIALHQIRLDALFSMPLVALNLFN
jgi:hypothetical protein